MDNKNAPLKSFLLHALVVLVVFVALGGAVFYWLGGMR